ncbi:MAG TPA: UbiA family prenyltransferase, partial [Nitrospiria bacterium]|nr:UbiA family prenyltransferase [Nitrospiria bacterium]
AILGGIFYSEGPLPVSSTPFGELLVALLMGPIEIVSADLAASGRVSSLAFVVSIPVGLMVAAILLTNNLRDIDKDRSRGRRTLAVLIGRRSGANLLLIMLVLTFLWTIPAFALFAISASVFLIWLAFPIALQSYYRIIHGGWSRSVVLISRVHVLVGTLLTISLLVHL